MITYEHIKATFASLVAIDSPSLSEREMADHIKALFAGIGITLLEDKSGTVTGSTAGNLYAYVEGDQTLEPVLLAAHMDTVAPACKKQAVFPASHSPAHQKRPGSQGQKGHFFTEKKIKKAGIKEKHFRDHKSQKSHSCAKNYTDTFFPQGISAAHQNHRAQKCDQKSCIRQTVKQPQKAQKHKQSAICEVSHFTTFFFLILCQAFVHYSIQMPARKETSGIL